MSKIYAPNFTQVPNLILDEMGNLSESELRVCILIARQTFGWHREKATLSIGFIEKATGLSRQSVITATKTLIQKGWVEKFSGDGKDGANVLKLVVNQLDCQSNQLTSSSQTIGLEVVQPLDTNKERQIKQIKKGSFPEIPESLKTPEFAKAWSEWLEDRKFRRKPVTPLAAAKQFESLVAMGAEKAVVSIRESIEHGWQGLFEPKNFKPTKPINEPVDYHKNNPWAHLT